MQQSSLLSSSSSPPPPSKLDDSSNHGGRIANPTTATITTTATTITTTTIHTTPVTITTSRIRPIPPDSVRHIVAGQVIFDLASAVKELVENALDAGSTSINIRLFNQGLDIIEVSDDGCGIPVDSRPFLAMPHATSKLTAWSDLYESHVASTTTTTLVRTTSCMPRTLLGFRGEALFALAHACQNLIILTRTPNDAMAQKLEFDRHGMLRRLQSHNLQLPAAASQPQQPQQQWLPRKIGTTVAAVRLWDAIPVRRLDLERRLPEQRKRLMRMLKGYAIFAIGVQLHWMDYVCANSNQSTSATANGDRPKNYRQQSILMTPGQTTTLEQTISAVLGTKFLDKVAPITIDLTVMVMTATQEGIQKLDNQDSSIFSPAEGTPWKIEGYLSKPPFSAGLTSSSSSGGGRERNLRPEQFFALNGRPVDLPKVTRLLNDMWRAATANTTGKAPGAPSCVWQFTLPNHVMDINITPDKRQVQFVNETKLLELIQDAVQAFWKVTGQFAAAVWPTDPVIVDVPLDTKNSGTVPLSPDRMRFNRRYAFSHDVAKIRLQHEYDDGRIRRSNVQNENGNDAHSDETGERSVSDPPASQSETTPCSMETEMTTPQASTAQMDNADATQTETSLMSDRYSRKRRRAEIELVAPTNQDIVHEQTTDHEENDDETEFGRDPAQSSCMSKKQRDSLALSVTDSEGTLHNQHHVTPSPMSKQPQEQENLESEQRMWREAKRKFNSVSTASLVHSEEEEEDDDEEEEEDNADGDVDDSDDGCNQDRDHEATTASSDVSVKGATPSAQERRSLFLQQFQASASRALDAKEKIKSHRLEHFGFRSEKEMKRKCARATHGDSNGLQSETLSVERSVKRRACASHVPVDADIKQQQVEEKLLSMSVSKTSPPLEHTPPVQGQGEVITWAGFGSAQQVIGAARSERLRMRERRRLFLQLEQATESKTDTSNSTSTPAGTTSTTTDKIVSLHKGDFARMEIVGQFNMGFIIAKTPDNHLYILDQHACDEQYNFEKFCRETVIHEQRLIAPMAIDLSPWEEACVLEHMDIFEKNGFRFQHDATQPPRQRLSLIGLPHSGASDGRKAVQFGKEDVSALCAILSGEEGGEDEEGDGQQDMSGGGTGADGSGLYGNNAVRRYAGRRGDSADRVIARLPKAVAMFASRACRSSIMIGKALSHQEMDRVVKKLEKVQHPWTCPHGRPTMRHLGDLTSVLMEDEEKISKSIGNAIVTGL